MRTVIKISEYAMTVIYPKALAYNPLNDSNYMSQNMKQYFQNKLYNELEILLEEERTLSLSLRENTKREADFVDQSSMEEIRFKCHAYQEHEIHLRHDVESALQRLADGTYGYCVETGKPIGVQRLIAAPYAMYCLDVQTAKEGHKQRRWG
jgi:DnaK suppressor protein